MCLVTLPKNIGTIVDVSGTIDPKEHICNLCRVIVNCEVRMPKTYFIHKLCLDANSMNMHNFG